MNKQGQNLRKIQRALRCKLHNQFYTKYLSKANDKVRTAFREEKNKYNLLKQQLKENKDRQKELQTNVYSIDQQVEQIYKDYNKIEYELETKYYQEILVQEIKKYQDLIQSNFDDLKKKLFRQDFELKDDKNLFPDTKFYRRLLNKEQAFRFNRKKIYQFLITIHLFINMRNNLVKKYFQNKDKLNLEIKNNQNLQNNETTEGQELFKQQQTIERDSQVLRQKKQGQELYQQNLNNYLFLRQQYQQIQRSNNQFVAYQTQDEQLKQKTLSIFNEIKQNIYKAKRKINENINLDSDDLELALLESKVKEYREVCIERIHLKEQNKQAIGLKQEQQLDSYDNQIKKIKQVLVKQVPQIDNLSDDEIQKEIDAVKTKILNLDQIITQRQWQIQDIKKRRCDSLKLREELRKKLLYLQKVFEENDRSISVESHESKQIQLKFNQLKNKTVQSQDQLLADLGQINIFLDGYTKKNETIQIQKEFETFITQLNQEGSNHINVSFEQYFRNQEQHLKKFEEEKKILLDKKNLILEDLAKYEQLRQEKKIGRQTIKKTIKKYKQQKERIKIRSMLFDLVVRK